MYEGIEGGKDIFVFLIRGDYIFGEVRRCMMGLNLSIVSRVVRLEVFQDIHVTEFKFRSRAVVSRSDDDDPPIGEASVNGK